MNHTKFHTACDTFEKAVNTLYDTVKDIVTSNGGFIDTQNTKDGEHLRDRIYGYIYRGDILCEEYVYGIRVMDGDLQALTVPVSTTCRITMSPEDFTAEDAEWTPLRNSDIIMTPTLQSIAESILQYTGKEKQEKQTGNEDRARLLAVQIKEEIGMSPHSVDRVAEIIREGLDGKDRTEDTTKKLIATLVRVNSEGESYVSRSFTKIDDEAIATIRGCIEEDYDGSLTPKEIDNCYLPALDTLKRDLADLDKETEFDFEHAGIPVWEYCDEIEDITYRIHLSILN